MKWSAKAKYAAALGDLLLLRQIAWQVIQLYKCAGDGKVNVHLRDRFLNATWQFFKELWKPFKYWHRIYVGLGLLQWHRGGNPYNSRLHLICLQLPLSRNLDVTHCCKVTGVALLSQSKQRPRLCQADSSNPHYAHIVMRRRSAQMSYKRKQGEETLAAVGWTGCIKILESDLWPMSIAGSRQTALCKQRPFRHLYPPFWYNGWQGKTMKP